MDVQVAGTDLIVKVGKRPSMVLTLKEGNDLLVALAAGIDRILARGAKR